MKRSTKLALSILLIYSLLSHAYPLIRYNGNWIDGDAAVMTAATEGVLLTGRVDTPGLPTYSGGYGYQAFLAFLSASTGTPVADLQTLARPFIGVLVALASFVFFSRVFRRETAGVLASSLVAVHSFTLFDTARGSHMALTLTLLYLVVWTWVRLMQKSSGQRTLIIAVQLVAFSGLISMNLFFALSVLVAFAGTAILVTFSSRISNRRLYWQLGSAALLGVVLLFFVVLFVYSPAMTILRATPTFLESISTIFVSFGEPKSLAYAAGGVVWSSTPIYTFLVLFELVVVPVSIISWVRFGIQRHTSKARVPEEPWIFLWFLSGTVGFQMAIAFLSDLSGGAGFGDNTALRLLPVYLIPGAAWTARLVIRETGPPRLVCRGTEPPNPVRASYAVLAAVLLLIVLAIAAPLRAFVDPVVAPGSWVGFDAEERIAAQWLSRAPFGTQVYTQPIYTANPASRIVWLYTMYNGPAEYGTVLFPTGYPDSTGPTTGDMYYTSSQEKARSPFIDARLPDTSAWSLAYDNGDAEVFYRG